VVAARRGGLSLEENGIGSMTASWAWRQVNTEAPGAEACSPLAKSGSMAINSGSANQTRSGSKDGKAVAYAIAKVHIVAASHLSLSIGALQAAVRRHRRGAANARSSQSLSTPNIHRRRGVS